MKGAKGGFAVGGLSNQSKATTNDLFKVTKDTSYFKTTVFTESNIVSTGTLTTGTGTTLTDLITDADGNTYKTVQIGNQSWMKENLRTTKYRGGTAINVDSVLNYNNSTQPDTLPITTFGKLYAFNVVKDSLCPVGWHVPRDVEFRNMLVFVGGPEWQVLSVTTGLKLIDSSTGLWPLLNISGNNSTGFSAYPGGYAMGSASWMYIGWIS